MTFFSDVNASMTPRCVVHDSLAIYTVIEFVFLLDTVGCQMMRHIPLKSMLSVVVSQAFAEKICLSGGADFNSCICSMCTHVF